MYAQKENRGPTVCQSQADKFSVLGTMWRAMVSAMAHAQWRAPYSAPSS